MSNMINGRGSCLCGATRITAKNINNNVGACHCRMCRQWGGGPLMAINCGTNISFEGEDNISIFSSSDWAERGFCRRCGSHLFYRLKESKQFIIPAGIFDEQDKFVFDNQIFIDKKPSFYSFINKTNDLTEAEVFEKYG
ncbi:MAG: GFA family protein [Spirochaetota bacterium]|nr:GFA family protein [Spirochaetota bacterium]